MNANQVAVYVHEQHKQTAIREAQVRLARALDFYRFTAATPGDREKGRQRIANAQDGVDRAINATLATGRDKISKRAVKASLSASIPLVAPTPTRESNHAARDLADRHRAFSQRQETIRRQIAASEPKPLVEITRPARSTSFLDVPSREATRPIQPAKDPYTVIIERDDRWRAEQMSGVTGQGNLFGPNGPTSIR